MAGLQFRNHGLELPGEPQLASPRNKHSNTTFMLGTDCRTPACPLCRLSQEDIFHAIQANNVRSRGRIAGWCNDDCIRADAARARHERWNQYAHEVHKIEQDEI